MKIFYRYKGFIRSSELNIDSDNDRSYVLLGEYGQDTLDLFGVFYVEKDNYSNSMYYSIDGFNKFGSGPNVPMEGMSFNILSRLLESSGWGQNINSEEEAMELLGLTSERIDVEIVPNPTGESPEDDIYTYLNPNDRIIKSCSKLIVGVPSSFVCIPTYLDASGFSEGFEYLTFKREDNPVDVITPPSSNSTEDQLIAHTLKIFEALFLSKDKVSLAFLVGDFLLISEPSFDEMGNKINFFSGLNESGVVNYAGQPYNFLDLGVIDIISAFLEGQFRIAVPTRMEPEVNILTVYPTPNVPQELDGYYLLGGDSSGEPLVIYSCAKAVINSSDGGSGDTIPSDFSYIDIGAQSTPSIFGEREVDGNIGACLKIQIDDNAPEISSFIKERRYLEQRNATAEQSAINFLFQKIASGINNPWGVMESMKSNPEIIYAGLSAFNINEVGGSGADVGVALVALNDFYLKSLAYKYVMNEPEIREELQNVSLDEIQAFINSNLNTYSSYTEVSIVDAPSTIIFSRCTQTDIDNLFEGNHSPHVDMFDSIKSLLSYENPEINSSGLASAIYYPERDVIEFKTKYRVEVTKNDY